MVSLYVHESALFLQLLFFMDVILKSNQTTSHVNIRSLFMLGSVRENNIADVWYRIYMYYTVTVYEKVWLFKIIAETIRN